MPTVTNRAVLLVTLLIAAVGALDAAVGRVGDLFTVFVLVGLLQLVLLLRISGRRPTVPVRADLVRWLRDRAEVEGESAERIVDRAVSSYRAGLVGDGEAEAGDPADGHRPAAPAGRDRGPGRASEG